MEPHQTTEGVYGPGSFTDSSFTPLPEECTRLLHLLASQTPNFTRTPSFLSKVSFHGSPHPIIPGPLKSQALSAVSHAMIGLVATEILHLRGVPGADPNNNDGLKIKISVDRAGLYPCTPALVEISGKPLPELSRQHVAASVGADLDKGVLEQTPMRYRSWAIYPTRDEGVYYQVMGSLHPVEFLKVYGLDSGMEAAKTRERAYEVIAEKMKSFSAAELEVKNMANGFCGQTCYSPEEWRGTEMGRSAARHPLINVWGVPGDEGIGAVPFAKFGDGERDRRPLRGVKVLELARVIAAPALCAVLASLGAEVVKVQSPNLPDLQSLCLTLTVGKRTTALDLNVDADREKLKKLFGEADVIVQAFRLGSLERKSFGPTAAFQMARERGKGVVYLDLNCYGPDGYYAERPGFQQISDAASGCSYVCGRAYGHGTPVLPSLPVADMLCGSFGVVDVLMALRDRATKGGSYHAHAALIAVDTIQLDQEVGLYQPEIVEQIQEKFKFAPMTPDLMVGELLATVRQGWTTNSKLLEDEDHFVTFEESPFGKKHRILAPIVQFEQEDIRLKWDGPPMPYCYEAGVSWKK